MTELASPAQLRAALLRWSLFTVPGVLLLGFLSGAVAGSTAGNPWFIDLVKPSLYPSQATFRIVWSILYAVSGLALAMVIIARGAPQRGLAIGLFVGQLLLNLAWSPLFFGAHQIAGALVLLLTLDVAVLACVAVFNKVRPLAAALMLPYLAWVLFATVLNWQILQANPDADGAENSGAVTSVEFK